MVTELPADTNVSLNFPLAQDVYKFVTVGMEPFYESTFQHAVLSSYFIGHVLFYISTIIICTGHYNIF